jgi:hypothetical protein
VAQNNRKKRPQSNDFQERFREYAKQMGKLGGKKRSENLTPERRQEIAKKAAIARWAKKKKLK